MSNFRRRAPAILKRRAVQPMPLALVGTLLSKKPTYSVRTAATLTENLQASAVPTQQTSEASPSNYCVFETADGEVTVDVWEVEVESERAENPGRKSVSTQADFPSRALTALNHQLADTCHKVCPTIGARALRDNIIEKLTEIVNDAEDSPKARFLLEQIFAYKTKMPQHSNFMTRHCKLLMDLSQKTYQHLKDVDGTGLLTLPTKGTLRNRYPETLPVKAKNEVEVLLQMEASAECPDGTTDDQVATYYYVVPSEEILPADMVDQ